MAKSTDKKTAPSPAPKAAVTARRESVGWGFWLICFAVLYGPSWFVSHRNVYESDREGFVPYVIAFALAAFGAGVLSYVVNLYYRIRADNEKKAARKNKKQAHNQ